MRAVERHSYPSGQEFVRTSRPQGKFAWLVRGGRRAVAPSAARRLTRARRAGESAKDKLSGKVKYVEATLPLPADLSQPFWRQKQTLTHHT